MKIIFICREFPLSESQSTGGFGRYVDSISRALVGRVDRVIIICQGETKKRIQLPDNREIVSLPKSKSIFSLLLAHIPFFGSRLQQFFEYPIYWSFNVYQELQKLTSVEHIDIIEGGDFGGELFFYLLLRKINTPVVIKLHTPSFVIRQYNNEKNNFFYRIMDILELTSLKKADDLLSPTRCLAEIVAKKIGRKVDMVIPYPYPQINDVTVSTKRKKIVLFAGKFQEKKGVFTLIQAAAKVLSVLPNVKFILVGADTKKGDKSVRKNMEASVENYHLQKHVLIQDAVSTKDLIKLYHASSITVIPSLWENFPNVCLEAMLCESAVIASKVGGLTEIIEHGRTGMLVDPGNEKELAGMILRLLTRLSTRERLVKAAKTMVLRRFDMDKIAGETEAFYLRSIENFNTKITE